MYGLWIKETTSTTGAGSITFGGAVSGFATVAGQFSAGEQVYYSILSGTNREYGLGTVAAGGVLQRTTVKATLVSGVYNDTSPTAISLTGVSEVLVTEDNVLLDWAEGVRSSAVGNAGKTLVVDAQGLAGLSDTLDCGTY